MAYTKKHKCSYGDVPRRIIEPYALLDARCTYDLTYLMFRNEVLPRGLFNIINLEHKVLPAVYSMVRKGVRIDKPRAEQLVSEVRGLNAQRRARILEEIGNPDFNLRSNPQVSEWLWRDRACLRFTKSGKPAADNLAILLQGEPVAKEIAKFRKADKAIGTYFKAILDRVSDDGRLRCNLNQSQAKTGRFSSSKPNLQNQPRPSETGRDDALGRIRECYVASKGRRLVCIDYSQIEIRILAALSGEEHLIEAILKGEDLHDNTCRRMFQLDEDHPKWKSYRYLSKRLNFAVVYGTGGQKFANTVLEDSEGDIRISPGTARDYIQKWWETHPRVRELQAKTLDYVARTGHVRTRFGRQIPVAPGKAHAALNYLIQGSAADVMKRAIVKVHKFLKNKDTDLLLTVHDELMFDMPRAELELVPAIVRRMEDRHSFAPVPLTVSCAIGKRWGRMKPLDPLAALTGRTRSRLVV